MSLWAAIKILWAYRAEIWPILAQIYAWVEAGLHEVEIQERLNLLQKAMDAALTTKNTQQLEDIFNPPPAGSSNK